MSRSGIVAKPVIQVHHRGDVGVDGILRLIELAGHDGPLETMLTAMCDQIAAITGVEIVSSYVREEWGAERLVMRGNHGFPAEAIGAVSLAIGEGITGLVAECMRPVSAAHAAAESAYKHVPGLGEEKYPVFAGIPLVAGGKAIGVLVLQRRRKVFAADEVMLATALAAPVTLAVERRRASAIRSVRLAGVAHVPGTVLGRAAVVPTATSFDAPELSSVGAATDRAFTRLRDDLGRAMKRLADAPEPAIGAALDRLALALCDARLREQLAAAAGRPAALRAVAKQYARASFRLGTEHGDYDDLCALLGDAPGLRPGAIWIGDRIGAFVALIAVARGATALVASDAIAPTAIAIARAAGIPALSDVAGLFGWVRPNDLLAITIQPETNQGAVLVHPAPRDIERLRQTR